LKDTASLRRYKLIYPWRSGRNYVIRIAENAFSGPFGGNKYFTSRFRAVGEDNYGSITLKITTPDTSGYVVQLVRDEKDIFRSNRLSTSTDLQYNNIPTGRYNIRVIYDSNKNGEWDTGNVKSRIQPEKVWIYPEPIDLKPNWEQEKIFTIPRLP
jgi:hypothetical protein